MGDIVVGNGTASAFMETTAGTVFTALITPAAAGTVTVDVAAGVAVDEADNGNTAAAQATSIYSVTDPCASSVTGQVWCGAVAVNSVIAATEGFGYIAAAHPVSASFGSLSDDDFEVDGTTYTVWRVTYDTNRTEFDWTFAVATGGTLTEFPAANLNELSVRFSDKDDPATTATAELSAATYGANYGYNWLPLAKPSGFDNWKIGDTAAVRLIRTVAADTTAPRVTSVERQDPGSSRTNADSLKWRITFSEDVENVGTADFAVSGTTATVTAVTEVTASTVYDVTVSGGNLAGLDATVTLFFASGQDIADTSGNNLSNTAPTGTNDNMYVVDNTAPTVAITGVPATSTAPFTATFTFSEEVNGFAVGDITVGNGAASAFTGQPGDPVFTALITPAADGMVTVDVAAGAATDAAGNGNPAAAQATSTYTAPLVDANAPRVTLVERQDPGSSPTNADSLKWRITFSENVENVGTADFAVSGTTATVTAVTEMTASTVYDVTVSGGNLAGLDATVTLFFASGQDIADTSDNNLSNTAPTGTNDNMYVVDNTAPTVTITGVPATSTGPFTATFTFSEEVNGFAVGDITVGNGAASGFTGQPGDPVFTALITPAASGTVTVEVAAGVATDAAGNGNPAAARASSTYTAPLVATAPGMPASFTATGGDRQVVLAWTAPVSDGGAAIEKYQYRYSAGSTVGTSAEWADVPDADADAVLADERSVTVGDLDNARQYTFEVRAVNGVRAGAAATARATPVRAPLPPGSGFLVGNFGQPVDGSAQIFVTRDIVGVFTTGARGADLHSIELRLNSITPDIAQLPSVTLYRASVTETRARRGARVAALTAVPGSPRPAARAQTVAFTAPGGTRLEAGATYLVVLVASSGRVGVEKTTFPAEDPGGAPGWAIDGTGAGNSSPWSYGTTASLLLRVNGTAAGEPGRKGGRCGGNAALGAAGERWRGGGREIPVPPLGRFPGRPGNRLDRRARRFG